MKIKCESCGQTKDVPADLWHRVIHGQQSKTLCPACYERLKNHLQNVWSSFGEEKE